MKKLMMIALVLAFTLPAFAQVPTRQDTTRNSAHKTMKKKDAKKGQMNNKWNKSDTTHRDGGARDTSRRMPM